jgi:hypothetical protein
MATGKPTLTCQVLMVRGQGGEFRHAAPSDASRMHACAAF